MNRKEHILEVGLWEDYQNWGEITQDEIVKRYIKLSKSLKSGDQNVIWVFGNYTKFLQAAKNNIKLYCMVTMDIIFKNVRLEDDACNCLNYHFIRED